MARSKKTQKGKKRAESVGARKRRKHREPPGLSLEKAVARLQQMFDPNSEVTHNAILADRIGNERQYDVVIRGCVGGQPILGVVECKDHGRPKGPTDIEAFATKVRNLQASFALMVSKKGFTKQALKLAKHEGIGTYSLLPETGSTPAFSVGVLWYARIYRWAQHAMTLHFDAPFAPLSSFEQYKVLHDGRRVLLWFDRLLHTQYLSEKRPGEHRFLLVFKNPEFFEVEGNQYSLKGITFAVTRHIEKRSRYVRVYGDGYFDWGSRQLRLPAKGQIVTDGWKSDFSDWSPFDGDIPASTHSLQLIFDLFLNRDYDEDQIPKLELLEGEFYAPEPSAEDSHEVKFLGKLPWAGGNSEVANEDPKHPTFLRLSIGARENWIGNT